MRGAELKKILDEIEANLEISQTDIAAKAKVNRSNLSKLANDANSTPGVRLLAKLHRAFPEYFEPTKQTEGLTIKEDQYTWIIASIMLVTDELVKLQVNVFDRKLEDCLQELENSRKLIIQRLKNGGT